MKIICAKECGNSPKNLFLKDFNIAIAKRDLSFIQQSLDEDVSWELCEPSVQKQIRGLENVLQEYKEYLHIVPAEFAINTVITHGSEGAVNGRIKANDGRWYLYADFYTFNSAKGTAIKKIISYIIKKN